MTKDGKLDVTLFDYGVGNLHSIRKALERGGATVTVTEDPQDLLNAEALVLPGVGAFGACMAPLEPIREQLLQRLLDGTPCLAVCIGMHLLFEGSEESPGVPGLGLFQGHIQTFDPKDPRVGKVPHMGWNTLHAPMELPPWDSRAGVGMQWRHMLPGADAHMYYVHSYYAAPREPVTVMSTTYGIEFAAVVAKGNTIATQFHPEKSSELGLAVVAHWADAAGRYLKGGAEAATQP